MSLPSTEHQLLELLKEVQWDRIAPKLSMPLEYGRYASDTLLKVHLLPYLIPIRSERQLAFAISEKEVLKYCVGLAGDDAPPRGTLWHFRKRNLHLFRRLLIRGLSIIYLEAEARKIKVPFLGSGSCAGEDLVNFDKLNDKKTGMEIEIRYPLASRLITREEQLSLPLDIQAPPFVGIAPRLFLPNEIGFPLRVTFRPVRDMSSVKCAMFQSPSWLDEPYGRFEVGDYIESSRTPYTACNIVITREIEGVSKILLSKRLQGAGKGSYTLPGGKKREGETVRACVRRELGEETGLTLIDARPISITHTHYQGYPRVRSIGVLAEVRGEPQRRERLQHSNWEWHDLANLPSPMFFPAELVLKDFCASQPPELTWDDVEEPDDALLWGKV